MSGLRSNVTYDFRKYDWTGLLAAMRQGPSNEWRMADGPLHSVDNPASKEWDLNLGFDGMQSLLECRSDWAEGRTAIEKQAAEQATRQIRKHRASDYLPADTGDFFDLDAIVQNRPEQWLALQECETGGERTAVNLLVSVSASCGVSALCLRDRMRAIAATALTLEAWNVPTRIVTCETTCNSTGWGNNRKGDGGVIQAQVVTLKELGEPIDLHRIVCAAHPAYLRRIHFRLTEQSPCPQVIAGCWRTNYGVPYDPTPEEQQEFAGMGETIYFPALFHDQDAARTMTVLHTLMTQRLGIRFADDGSDDNE